MDDQVESPSLKLPLHNSAQPRDKEPEDVKKLREWQQQRLERRLRGDYESAVIHLSQVVCFFLGGTLLHARNSCHDFRLTTISTRQLV